MVTGKDQHIFRFAVIDKITVLIDRIGRALIPVTLAGLLERRKNKGTAVISVQIPRMTVTDIGI